MAEEFTMRVDGLSELRRKLLGLSPNIARNALRASVYAGAKVIRDEAKLKAPLATGDVSAGHPPPGTLRRSIIMKQIPEESGMQRQTFYVAVRHGKKYARQGKKGNLSQDAYYWRFVEFGTVNMSAQPFLRPAFEGKKTDAVEAIKSRLATRIEDLAK